jgi:hypothetical protein
MTARKAVEFREFWGEFTYPKYQDIRQDSRRG